MHNLSACKQLLAVTAAASAVSFAIPSDVAAAGDNADLQQRIESIEQELQKMKGLEQELNDLKQELASAKKQAQVAEKKANEGENTFIKFHISGAGVANFTATDNNNTNNFFGGGDFLPIIFAKYKDWLLFEAHPEFSIESDGETKVELEYAQLDAMVTDWLTVSGGKFLTPIGQFQQALHPPWINKLPDRPAGFVEDGGAEPLNEVGFMARGGFPIGDMRATYAVFVGNGPRLAEEGVILEGSAGDDNENKAFGGRVSFLPWPFLEFGFSGMHARIKGIRAMAGGITSADYDMIGGDVAFTKGPWDIRGEILRSHLDPILSALDPGDAMPTAIQGTTWTNWYVQAAYRLSGLTDNPILGNFEPVVQYGQFDEHGFAGFNEGEEDRVTVGLDYWFGPSVVGKVAYERRNFHHAPTDNVFRVQFAYGF